jgi:hypothetical protein
MKNLILLSRQSDKSAKDWCDFIQSQHPKDEVFVIERFEP